jgi:spore maturation protein CgeB
MNRKYESLIGGTGLKGKKILLAHSNQGAGMHTWHERRRISALNMGYNVSLFSMTQYLPYTIFPYLEKKWKKRDSDLMKLYDELGKAIDVCDIFIHFNGALIHPEFLEQFKKIKVYHCADDPDASSVLSKPVASHYDVCAISNPTCIDMYRKWGCKQVFFWPLGAFHFEDSFNNPQYLGKNHDRDIPIIFIGSKVGVSNIRYIGSLLGLYRKKGFMKKIDRNFPQLLAYGSGWANGRVADESVPDLYRQSKLGINIHNSLGPINGRLYDLAAFGVCQICDNKKNLSAVFEEGKEIIGFETEKEAIDLLHYYLQHPEEAMEIGWAGQQRFLKDYTMSAIWSGFFENLGKSILPNL